MFNFKRRNLLSGPHLLGILLIIAGVFSLSIPMFFNHESSMIRTYSIGSGAMLVGLIIVFTYGGTLIDFTEKRYKEYLSIVGYRFGEWVTLPHVVMVKVVSSSYTSTNTPNGISPTFSGKETNFKIMIYNDGPKPIFSFVYTKKAKAVINAKSLANNLNVDFVNNIPAEGQCTKL